MSVAADLLTASRSAHQRAKQALSAGHREQARELFRSALDNRLAARKEDPDRMDPAWLEDAKPSGVAGRVQARMPLRVPGMTVQEVAAQLDVDLERFFQEALGEVPKTVIPVTDPEVVTPKAWVVSKPGQRDDDGVLLCKSRHVFQLVNFGLRRCQTCEEVQELRETLKPEETIAFQTKQAEAENAKERRK